MAKTLEEKLDKVPVVGWSIRKSKKILLPGMDGFTLYDLCNLYFSGIVNGDFMIRSSAIAYSFFITIFPFLLFLLNLIPFVWFIDDLQLKVQNYINSLLPPQTSDFFNEIFMDIANNQRVGLLSVVFVLSIYLMANGINSVFAGFRSSYYNSTSRPFWRQYLVAIGVSIIVALLLLITVIGSISLIYVIENLKGSGILTDNTLWIKIVQFVVFAIMVYLGSATMYYFGTTNRKKAKFFSVGALFSLGLVIITTSLFAIYINNFSSYNELYGSIGALMILLFYIWLNSNILLLGFELNSSIQKMKESTNNTNH